MQAFMLARQVHRSDRRQETPVGDRGLGDAWPCRQQGHRRGCVVPLSKPHGGHGGLHAQWVPGLGKHASFAAGSQHACPPLQGARPLLSSKAVSCTDVLGELVAIRAAAALLAGCAECERWWGINFHTLRSFASGIETSLRKQTS